MAKMEDFRGLTKFIGDIRSCSNKDLEEDRVQKELTKIKKAFGEVKKKDVKAYNKKKYVWKLLYIYMLGYDVEFGHKQASELISSTRYADKQVGYIACSVLLDEKDEFLRLIINSVLSDLQDSNDAFQGLSLSFIGSVGGQEMAEALTDSVVKVLCNTQAKFYVRKKACLALLRLYKKQSADGQDILPAEQFASKINSILDEKDVGLLMTTATLLSGVALRDPVGFAHAVPKLVRILYMVVVMDAKVEQHYKYYGIVSPWLQIKCLRCLQCFYPSDDPEVRDKLAAVVKKVMADSSATNVAPAKAGPGGRPPRHSINLLNAKRGILFEALPVALKYELGLEVLEGCVTILSGFLSQKDPNVRYLALEAATNLAQVPEVQDAVKKEQAVIVDSLRDADMSIRRRGMELLFTICDATNSEDIVQEMLTYLLIADAAVKAELVLKIAILAERFAPSVSWYVDVFLQLIENAGEAVTDDIWHRVVQLISNNEDMQPYAVGRLMEVLDRSVLSEPLLCTASYVLGEFGGTAPTHPPADMFRLLDAHFANVGMTTRGLMLTAYMKLLIRSAGEAGLKASVEGVLRRCDTYADPEVQQRAVEYLRLVGGGDGVRGLALQPMPEWPERESSLMRRLRAEQGVTEAADGEDDGVAAPDGGVAAEDPTSPTPRSATTPAGLTGGGGSGSLPPASPTEVDLLGDLTSPTVAATASAAAASVEAAAAAQQASAQELTTVDDFMSAMAPPPPVREPAPSANDPFAMGGTDHAIVEEPASIQVQGDMGTWYNSLLINGSGVLYEDTFLQLGIKSMFQGQTGTLTVFWGNKSQTDSLNSVACTVPPCVEVEVALEHTAVPSTIGPGEQLQVPISLTCKEPFLAPPKLQVGYALGESRVAQELKLPVVVTKFLTPRPELPKETFYAFWRQLQAPNKESEIAQRNGPLGVEGVGTVLEGLGFGAPHGHFDPNADNDAGAGAFNCEKLGGLPCLVRIEVLDPSDRSRFKCTVASKDNVLTSALLRLVVHQLTNW